MNILIALLAFGVVVIVITGCVVIASDRVIPGRSFFEYVAGDGLNVFSSKKAVKVTEVELPERLDPSVLGPVAVAAASIEPPTATATSALVPVARAQQTQAQQVVKVPTSSGQKAQQHNAPQGQQPVQIAQEQKSSVQGASSAQQAPGQSTDVQREGAARDADSVLAQGSHRSQQEAATPQANTAQQNPAQKDPTPAGTIPAEPAQKNNLHSSQAQQNQQQPADAQHHGEPEQALIPWATASLPVQHPNDEQTEATPNKANATKNTQRGERAQPTSGIVAINKEIADNEAKADS